LWLWISRVSSTILIAAYRYIPSEYRQITGVHSLERSAQEDTLLVLFNTAISNLVRESHSVVIFVLLCCVEVLFRNNFALSRDITGLFQSFQSSSSVLDPASNPSLFQSTLVVIIKV